MAAIYLLLLLYFKSVGGCGAAKSKEQVKATRPSPPKAAHPGGLLVLGGFRNGVVSIQGNRLPSPRASG